MFCLALILMLLLTASVTTQNRHQSCGCGAANVVEVRGHQATPQLLATIPAGRNAGLEIQAVGAVKFAEADSWRSVFDVVKGVVRGGTAVFGTAKALELSIACPKCLVAFGVVEGIASGLDLFLGGTGSEKAGDAYGRDPLSERRVWLEERRWPAHPAS